VVRVSRSIYPAAIDPLLRRLDRLFGCPQNLNVDVMQERRQLILSVSW
jgi:hypothetical protein